MFIIFLLFFSCLFSGVFTDANEVHVECNLKKESLEQFANMYPKQYQDILIQNQVAGIGSNNCSDRFELIRSILDKYERQFSVLDIGACEGYFSFKIAEEYAAACTMVEGGYYQDKPNKLQYLCNLNKHLKNIYLLHHRFNLQSLADFSKREHFDVVLAFLVIHQMSEQNAKNAGFLENAKKYTELILSLGNDVIIETSTDIYPLLDQYISNLCAKEGGVYLGELPRYKDKINGANGRFYYFKNKNSTSIEDFQLFKTTFEKFGGVYFSGDMRSTTRP